MSKSPHPINLLIPGDIEHNQGIVAAVGSLVVTWSNAESVFLAILQVLLGRSQIETAIVWYSFRGSTKARLDLILRLSRKRIKDDPQLISDIEKGLLKVSNLQQRAQLLLPRNLRDGLHWEIGTGSRREPYL